MAFSEPKFADRVGGAASASPAAPPVDPARAAAIRAALDAGAPPRAELAQAAASLRALRLRGFRADDFEGVRAALAPLDATEARAARDHAWAVGAPEPADPEQDRRVGARGPSVDLGDLFADAPAAAEISRFAATVAATSPDLPALAVLVLASTACAAKVVGACPDRVAGRVWRQPPSLYVCAEVASGEGKTLVRDVLGGSHLSRREDAVAEWHAILEESEQGRREWGAERRKVLALELAKAAKAGDEAAGREIGLELARFKLEADRPPAMAPTWLQWGTVTPENFVRHAQAGGFIALFPDEGRATLSRFIGEGGGKEYIEPLLTAFSRGTFSHSTIEGEKRKDRAKFRGAGATLFLPIQPGVLSPATPEAGALLTRLAQRGFFARMITGRPPRATAAELPALIDAGEAALADAAEVARVQRAWDDLLGGALHAEGPELGDGEGTDDERAVGRPHPLTPSVPWEFAFEPAAARALLDYQRRTRIAAAPGGEWDVHGMSEFVKRLADHAHRLATLLAILRAGGIEGGGQVLAADVERAIRFLDGYALPHAEGVHRRAIFDPIGDDAEVVLGIVRKLGEATQREIRRRLPGGGRGWQKARAGDRVDRLGAAVEALAVQGRILSEPGSRGTVVLRAVGD